RATQGSGSASKRRSRSTSAGRSSRAVFQSASTRLRQLASSMGGQAAVLRGDLGYGSAEGWTTVWGLTAEGFEIGSQWLGLKLDRMPKDVATAEPRLESRRLQPDAMIEDPTARRRYFIEYEAGSATIRDAKKSTSTMAKLDRYGTFLRAPAGDVFAGERETFYTRAFKDGWPAEVFFVSPSEARRDSITRVIAEREHSDKYKFPARALTLAEARRVLCRALD